MNEIETFFGPIESTADALQVFELCRQGRLGRVRRRLHEKERRLIRSGSVFVFDEQESGIRRWTDGRLWSPSRILGNFLIYRELERKVVDARKRLFEEMESDRGGSVDFGDISSGGVDGAGDPNGKEALMGILPWLATPVMGREAPSGSSDGSDHPPSLFLSLHALSGSSDHPAPPSTLSPHAHSASSDFVDPSKVLDYRMEVANSLLGPNAGRLLRSKKLSTPAGTRYIFKPAGLIKKTISARVDGRMQHLVAYFTEADFIAAHSGRHTCSRLVEELRRTRIPADLVLQQNFRKAPTAEQGMPLVERGAKRRHSVHAPAALSNAPICPRMPVDLLALDLASTSWSHPTAGAVEEVPLLPEGGDLVEGGFPLLDQLPQSMDASSNAIMEECIQFVLGNAETAGSGGMFLSSEDPTLPIIDRPDSELAM